MTNNASTPSSNIAPDIVSDAMQSRAAPRKAWRGEFLSALGVGIATFVVYLLTLAPSLLPGEQPLILAQALGLETNLMTRHAYWCACIRFLDSFGHAGILHRSAVFAAFLGACSVAMLYAVMRKTLRLCIEGDMVGRLPVPRRPEAFRHAKVACHVGAIATAVCLAFSVPFWVISTQGYFNAFYVVWILAGLLCLIRYFETRRSYWAWIFAFLHAGGMTQAPSFIVLAPLFFGGLFVFAWRNNRIRPRNIVALGIAVALGLLLVVFNVVSFHGSEGAQLNRITSAFTIFRLHVKGLLNDPSASLPRVGWMIILGLSILPWLATLIAGHRAINGSRELSVALLNIAIAVVTVYVVLDFKGSPNQFFGVGSRTVIPYVLCSFTFGYLAAYAYLFPLHIWLGDAREGFQRLSGVLACFAAVAFLALAAVAAGRNFSKASYRHGGFVGEFVDATLDGMNGRTWLATRGWMNPVFELRAHERGQSIQIFPMNLAGSSRAAKSLRRRLPDARLRNSLDLGGISLLQEWMSDDDLDPRRDLAIVTIPDLWNLSRFQMFPHGTLFLGATKDELEAIDPVKTVEEHEALWDRFEASMGKVTKDDPEMLRVCIEEIVRPQLSFVGNNLGYTLEGLGHTNLAYRVYDRVHRFDKDNVSALLNWASLVLWDSNSTGLDISAELKEKAKTELSDFAKKTTVSRRVPIWSLSRVYGFVSKPEQFAQLGWSWAGSGQPQLAMKALEKAESTISEEKRNALRSSLARINLEQGDVEKSESIYYQMLVEDPGNIEALLGLVNIYTMRGDTNRAREFMERATRAGAPRSKLQIAAALIARVDGNNSLARAILQELIDLDPQNEQALSHLCLILVQENDASALRSAIDRLEKAAGADAYAVLIARGEQSLMMKAPEEARDYFVRAAAKQPNLVSVREQILRIDFQLLDKQNAREHARNLLRLDRLNGFANYVLGSLAIDGMAYDEAEAYLRRSIDAGPNVANLNDLAVVLIHKRQYEEAAVRVKQAMEADSTVGAVWDTLALIQMHDGKLDEAEASLSQSIKLDPEDLRTHMHLADVMYRKGNLLRASELVRFVAEEAHTLPRDDLENFDRLHVAVLGVKYTRKH